MIVLQIMIITIMITKESTKPVMAMPRGALNIPIMEKTSPKNHNIMSTIGIQQKTKPNKAIIKPAVPILFDPLFSTTNVVVFVITLGAVAD